jgi:hypothetical protein
VNKWELEYWAGYSLRLERMHSVLLGRFDKLVCGIQFLAGMVIFADIASTKWAGAFMAILSVATFILQPGNKAAEAGNQAKRYQAFRLQIKSMPLTDARQEFAKIQESDSAVLGALCNAAEFGELVRLGASPPFKLSTREKCLAWFAGDLPRMVSTSA